MKEIDRTNTTEDWGGHWSPTPRLGEITLDEIPAVKTSSESRPKPLEISERVIRFGVLLLIAATIGGTAEASARANFGRHAHEVFGDLVELGMAELGITPQSFNNSDSLTQL